MPDTSQPGNSPPSETDQTLTELGRGKAERAVLGRKPYGSMVRMVVVALLFVVVFGTIFYLAQG